MSTPRQDSEDLKLSERLRSARPAPALPPRFGEHVWRRIETTSDLAQPANTPNWLESLARLILRPRVAFATAAVLVIAGALLGSRDNPDFAHKNAQTRYVAAVVPHVLH